MAGPERVTPGSQMSSLEAGSPFQVSHSHGYDHAVFVSSVLDLGVALTGAWRCPPQMCKCTKRLMAPLQSVTQAYSEGMNEHECCTLYVVECAVDLFESLGSEI